MKNSRSTNVMERSRNVFPGGVNSPVRSFRSVGGDPVVFASGSGKHLYDVDGNAFVDFCSSWGPLILGYSPKSVVEAVQKQAARAMSFGAPSEEELKLGEKIKSWIPEIDLLRFVSSGTEATMSAIRVARAATKKNKIIKFEGCYHGHADSLLVAAGSGLATLGTPSSAGVPAGAVQDTIVVAYNSVAEVEKAFAKFPNDIACVIIEPVACNMGLVKPEAGFLKFLREITSKHNSALIFDEVMTGFRLCKGGAAHYFKVTPDLWCFGKIIGGGLPAAAYGGTKQFMSVVSPLGPAYQAGTLSGNPLAMTAGLATLDELEKQNAFEKLEVLGKQLDGLVKAELGAALESGKVFYEREASFFCFFFGTKNAPKNFSEVSATDMKLFNKVYHAWLQDGIYMGPSGYEVGFLCTEHNQDDLKKLVKTIKDCVS